MDIVFFNVCKIYFRLPGFIEALDSKGIINTLKISFTSAMECTQTLQLSLSPRDKQDRVYMPEATVINFAILRVFLVGLCK